MGTKTSKVNSRSTISTVNENDRKRSIINKTRNYNGWQEINQYSQIEWLHGIAESYGFYPHKFDCNSKLYDVCAPGFCSESLSRKINHESYRSSLTKSEQLREHFLYNHIPAMISSLQNYSVYGIVNGCSISSLDRNDTIMLLVYSTILEKSKFIIVDLKLNRFVCALGNDYNGLINVRKVHAAWSIDKTHVIIRLPITSVETAAYDFYKITKKEAKLYRRIIPTDINSQFQFCPNYWSSHLILYMHSTQSQSTTIHYNTTSLLPASSNKIQILPLNLQLTGSQLYNMNFHTWTISNSQKLIYDSGFSLLSLIYTPDSVYLILTFVDNLCHCESTSPKCYFEIYHAVSLQRLKRIYREITCHLCSWHMCRNIFTPVFSASSSAMAFCTTKTNNDKGLQVSIVFLPNELKLKSICRRFIIEYLYQLNVNIENIRNSLPYNLSQYIQYRPEYQ